MKIKNYEIIINEQNATCGLVVDQEEYDLSYLQNKELTYEVLQDKKELKLYNRANPKEVAVFGNVDTEMVYYTIKTLTLAILVGKLHPTPQIAYVLEAELK